jgi:hypothetical protein
MQPYRLALITPVLNDWESLALLIDRIATLYDSATLELFVLVIDDGSTDPLAEEPLKTTEGSCVKSIEIQRLATNLGHQRAIAVGLVTVASWDHVDGVLVMDSDGEDRPEEIAALVNAARSRPDTIILAQRTKRSERLTFKIGYGLYKLVFWALTGQRVSSGNFSLVPAGCLKSLIYMPTLWNNIPATLIRSRFPVRSVPTIRGKRYAGQPKMNLISLVTHGLSATSVYVDVIFVRLLLASAGLILLTLVGGVSVLLYKLFTDLATPGWATTVVSSLAVILLQTMVFMVGITLMLLGGRTGYAFVPALDSTRFVASSKIVGRCASEPLRAMPEPEPRDRPVTDRAIA